MAFSSKPHLHSTPAASGPNRTKNLEKTRSKDQGIYDVTSKMYRLLVFTLFLWI